jgi:hypothetical protein
MKLSRYYPCHKIDYWFLTLQWNSHFISCPNLLVVVVVVVVRLIGDLATQTICICN